LQIIAVVQIFTEPFLLTNGGPGRETLTPAAYIYNRAFIRMNMGYASVWSVSMIVVPMVALSFLRGPEDVLMLEDRLAELDAQHLGIVLKIENAAAFRNLPRILLASLRSPPVGVMVARGDLAVEVGFERLSEVQEEILWLCEAAHVPVIWATQVLETLAKRGAKSRPEITDAAMSVRAECVMLNKGDYILDALRVLGNILSRMEAHQQKKAARLRALHW